MIPVWDSPSEVASESELVALTFHSKSVRGSASGRPATWAGVSEPDCALTLQLSDEADYPQPMSDSSEHVVWLAAGPVQTRCAGQRRATR